MHLEHPPVRYPALFKTTSWGSIQATFNLAEQIPDENLIANVNVVPYCEDGWVIVQMKDAQWEIPGGTLEPGESYLSAARRELLEEAGALLRSFRIFGAWRCRSFDSQPYRPHLPFPEFFRVAGIGEVEMVGNSTNPPGCETITRVEVVPIGEAAARFESIGRTDLAELYLLARDLMKATRT